VDGEGGWRKVNSLQIAFFSVTNLLRADPCDFFLQAVYLISALSTAGADRR